VSSQEKFLIVNGLIVTLVVLSFFLMRKGPRPPVKLDLMSGTPESPSKVKAPDTKLAPVKVSPTPYKPRPRAPQVDQDADTSPGRAPQGVPEDTGGEISLNVLFNWNGHTWDAYEVLGLPAGSSRDKVSAAFQTARGKADPETVPFLQAAYDAITRG
jgi:hypothetical protein